MKSKSCRINQAIARSIRQDQDLIFYRKDGAVEANEYFIMWHFEFDGDVVLLPFPTLIIPSFGQVIRWHEKPFTRT